tara:strand:- start:1743 stop:2387 length:645 start_codon:yes stop_codon:yes gene_type:complete
MNFSQLKDRAAVYLDDPHKTRHRDGELGILVNFAVNDVKRIMQDGNETYFAAYKDYSVTGAADTWEDDLEPDFSTLISVENVSESPPLVVYPVDFPGRHPVRDDRFVPAGFTTEDYYYLRGGKIGVVSPDKSFTLRLHYTKSLSDLSGTEAPTDIPQDYHDLICLRAAKRGYAIEQMKFPPGLDELAQELTDQVVALVEDRSRHMNNFINIQDD